MISNIFSPSASVVRDLDPGAEFLATRALSWCEFVCVSEERRFLDKYFSIRVRYNPLKYDFFIKNKKAWFLVVIVCTAS